jgi:hypothetical protein
MAATIKELNNPIVKGDDIERVIIDQLNAIDSALRRADVKWGINIVEYKISNNFNFPGLDRSDAETIIYSRIMESLEKRGFHTNIVLQESNAVLCISWRAGSKKYDLKKLKKYIEKKQIMERNDIYNKYAKDDEYDVEKI